MATITIPTGEKVRTQTQRRFVLIVKHPDISDRQVEAIRGNLDGPRVIAPYVAARSDRVETLRARARRLRNNSWTRGDRMYIADTVRDLIVEEA